MSAPHQFAYAQARAQARHGDRLRETDWQVLEAARSIENYLDRARRTWLRRFTERLDAQMDAHAIERGLRAAWALLRAGDRRLDAARLAPSRRMVRLSSRSGDHRGAHLPTCFAGLGGRGPCLRRAHRKQAASHPPRGGGRSAAARTADPGRRTHRSALAFPLAIPLARRHRAFGARFSGGSGRRRMRRVAADGGDGRTLPPRAGRRVLVRHFRRSSGTAAAIFCHLGLVAIDIERARGAILRRLLFANDAQRGAP